jgi:uncharacterized protein YndB with AHSA1/START domain
MNARAPPPTRPPDLTGRPYDLAVEHRFAAAPAVLYQAWTRGMERWFAAPGSLLMRPEVDAVYFFETEFKREPKAAVERHPHYGRFLRLIENQLIELTWVTGAKGTEGAETVVTVELHPAGEGTRLCLKHSGFPDAIARDRHREAWPMVLCQLEERLAK